MRKKAGREKGINMNVKNYKEEEYERDEERSKVGGKNDGKEV